MSNDVELRLGITNQLIAALHCQQKFDEAEELQQRALKIAQTLDQANPLRFRAIIIMRSCSGIRKLDEVADIHEKVLRARRKRFGNRRIETLLSLLALAKVYGNQRRFAQAELVLREMVKNSGKLLGRNH